MQENGERFLPVGLESNPSHNRWQPCNHHVDTFDSEVDEQILEHTSDSMTLEYDGYDVDGTGRAFTLYFYGRDANEMLEEIKRLLSSIQLSGAFVATLRFGPADDEKAVEHRQEFVLQIWWIAIWQIALSLYLESYCNMWVKIGNGFALI